MPCPARTSRPLSHLLPVLLLLLSAGCSTPPPSTVSRTWIAACAEPAFDPDGPPQALRWSIERLLSRGLLDRDSTGRVTLAAAESVRVSADGRTWTFRLRAGLRFTDGSPVTSDDFRAALGAGLSREDHGTRAWQLAGVLGVDRVRAGRTLPPLGIQAPDPRTLVLRLAWPDTLLAEKLATPGVATPWKRRDAGEWGTAVGIGPYRVLAAEPGRSLLLVSAGEQPFAAPLADTLRVRFIPGAARLRSLMRQGVPDLAWPLPPAFMETPPPEEYRLATAPSNPVRRLLLVLRADVPPTTKPAARHALAHATNRAVVLEALGSRGRAAPGWLEGGGEFDFPRFDTGESQAWLDRGRLGASIHVTLAYDADLAGAEVARALQGEWARQGFYAELRALRGKAALDEPLRAAAAQAQLVESQAIVPGLAGELVALVMPLRGPAVGSFRTGWRTREFDPWLLPARPAGAPLDPRVAQARVSGERIVLPLADLPWLWAERQGQRVVRLAPGFGPEFASTRPGEPLPSGNR